MPSGRLTYDMDEGDQQWAVEIVPGYEGPSWFILNARRHSECITGLNNAELGNFVYRTPNLVVAGADTTGAPATYVVVFGEDFPLLHLLIAPRGEDVPTERRAGDILKPRFEQSDPGGAPGLLPAVRLTFAGAAKSGWRRGPQQAVPGSALTAVDGD